MHSWGGRSDPLGDSCQQHEPWAQEATPDALMGKQGGQPLSRLCLFPHCDPQGAIQTVLPREFGRVRESTCVTFMPSLTCPLAPFLARHWPREWVPAASLKPPHLGAVRMLGGGPWSILCPGDHQRGGGELAPGPRRSCPLPPGKLNPRPHNRTARGVGEAALGLGEQSPL